MTENQHIFTLEKSIWTHNDYEQMGWHDCSIYGLIFLPTNEIGNVHLVFDIDYIFKRGTPLKTGQPISFWISPCTLIFNDTFALTMNVDKRGATMDMLEVADLYLVDEVEQEANHWIYEWKIELQEGYINFKSSGFDQIVRQKPILSDGQFLTIEERDGISFSQTPYTV